MASLVRSCVVLIVCCAGLAAATYEVGPGKALATIGAVPWADLEPGDLILIHHRAEPYREKWVINRSGTAEQPIVVRGVPAESSELPVVEAEGAVTAPGLDYWNEARSLLKIGGSNVPSNDELPSHIVVEGLVLRGAYPGVAFTDDEGKPATYGRHAAGFHIERGAHITLRGCVLTGNGNGVFCAGECSEILIEGCHFYGNGVEGRIYEHNAYTEASGMTYRGNRFGPLRPGAPGNNLKDRSAGLMVAYNWIDGGNRCLDLVESDDPAKRAEARYRETWVVGNVLLTGDGGNDQVIHYGGDQGDPANFRQGTLHLSHNTIFSRRSGRTTLLRLSSGADTCIARGNIIHATAGGAQLGLLAEHGAATLRDNWLTAGAVDSYDPGYDGSVERDGSNQEGDDPGLVDPDGGDYRPAADSPNRDAAGPVPDWPLDRSYRPHRQVVPRPDDGRPDRGAFERVEPEG